ncbi:hypothetical protein N657DRAFT_635946 [Parathielavia appendiculata]|uniref:Uncharacterized protein n=1 Tax=Parathielavia appendiculata TaxID=2587402 RepID=A0AAN6TWA4_9PEZI|nr:hypothetical protein N657DRAFT_635946 [Parathielavia appendiculata]
MPPAAPTDSNPNSAKEWWKRAQYLGYPDPSLLDITTYEARSASKFSETDSIYLKAVWQSRPVIDFHIAEYEREEYVARAQELMGLKPSPPLEAVERLLSIRLNLANFLKTVNTPFGSLTRPTPWPSSPRLHGAHRRLQKHLKFHPRKSEDEEIVNTAPVQLLVCTTLCSGIGTMKGRGSNRWYLERLETSTKPTLAILEVKQYKRGSSRQKIEWQEACQMAAWISTSLREKSKEKRTEGILRTSYNGKNRRILISQDYRALYLTVGQWGKGYERYLHGEHRPLTPPSKTNSPSRNLSWGRTDAKPAAAAAGGASPPRPRTPNRAQQAQAKTTTSPARAASPQKPGGQSPSDTTRANPASRTKAQSPARAQQTGKDAAAQRRDATDEDLDEDGTCHALLGSLLA